MVVYCEASSIFLDEAESDMRVVPNSVQDSINLQQHPAPVTLTPVTAGDWTTKGTPMAGPGRTGPCALGSVSTRPRPPFSPTTTVFVSTLRVWLVQPFYRPPTPATLPSNKHCIKMSAHDNEELIDYEDEHDVVANGAAAQASNAAAASAPAADGAGDDKKNFSGIHSTGFRLVDSYCARWRSS